MDVWMYVKYSAMYAMYDVWMYAMYAMYCALFAMYDVWKHVMYGAIYANVRDV